MELLTMEINSETNTKVLYDFISNNLSFNKMIELHKLISHKIQFLDDEPTYDLRCKNKGSDK